MYNPGDDVTGTISLHAEKEVKMKEVTVLLAGWCETRWVSDSGGDQKVYKAKEEYCSDKLTLWGGKDQEVGIAIGTHQKEFRFQLPTNCPSSYESKNGHVYYMVQVLCKIQGILNDQWESKRFRVYDKVDLSANRDYAELLLRPLHVDEEQENESCLCLGKATLQADLTFDKSAYAPGDCIYLNGHIFNGCDKALECTFTLKQGATCFGRTSDLISVSELKSKEKSVGLSSWQPPKLTPRETREFKNEEIFTIAENTQASGLRNCNLIELEYYIEVSISSLNLTDIDYCVTVQTKP
ncbi:unnamed protein product [Clavelina lepadiformis]|uniref:Arrestin C-terminal-like domain-containing protein n=1 Tax=Clavelina lepadiformis TaxID=159417 RepID=A0ABP0F2M3_CLALP